MKLIPMKKYKKRCTKASDERLLKMLNAARFIRDNPAYEEAVTEELDKRGIKYE